MEIIQQTAALPDHHQQSTAGTVIFDVVLQVRRKAVDPLGQESNLNISRASVFFVLAKLTHDFRFRFRILAHLRYLIFKGERLGLANPRCKGLSRPVNHIDLQGRRAVITGGARGIGLAIARRLLDSGAACCLWDLDATAATEAANHLAAPGRVFPQQVNVCDAASVQAAAQATIARLGGVEILVNNAGIAGATKKTWELTPEEWQQVLQIDLFGPYLCCHALVPGMLAQHYGRIINIASIAGKEGNPNASHYSAAKAGLIALTKSLGKELATSGVLVNCITPAVIQTDILKQISQQHIDYMLSKIPMGRFGRVDEAAALVAWLASDDCSFSTGAVFDLSGGRATY